MAPAGPVYDQIGRGYAERRDTDPRWAEVISDAVGAARSIVSVGAGTGSYEPTTTVVAVEPSGVMVAQRPVGAAPAVRGVAERLPLRSSAVDVALVVLSLHHWTDWRAGLSELRRVSRRQVVVTFDPTAHEGFWLVDEYLPEIADLPLNRPPTPAELAEVLGGGVVSPLPVPHDMVDGILWAGWRRPERYLDPAVLAGASSTAALPPEVLSRGIEALRADLASGEWHRRHANLLARPEIDGGFRLVVSGEAGAARGGRSGDGGAGWVAAAGR